MFGHDWSTIFMYGQWSCVVIHGWIWSRMVMYGLVSSCVNLYECVKPTQLCTIRACFIDIFVLRYKKPAPQIVLSRVRLLYNLYLKFDNLTVLNAFLGPVTKSLYLWDRLSQRAMTGIFGHLRTTVFLTCLFLLDSKIYGIITHCVQTHEPFPLHHLKWLNNYEA